MSRSSRLVADAHALDGAKRDDPKDIRFTLLADPEVFSPVTQLRVRNIMNTETCFPTTNLTVVFRQVGSG